MSLKLNDVAKQDRGAIAPCGIICLGCDLLLDEGLDAAKVVVNI